MHVTFAVARLKRCVISHAGLSKDVPHLEDKSIRLSGLFRDELYYGSKTVASAGSCVGCNR